VSLLFECFNIRLNVYIGFNNPIRITAVINETSNIHISFTATEVNLLVFGLKCA